MRTCLYTECESEVLRTELCYKHKALEKRNTRRKIAIEYLGAECASCGATDGLEFDHIDRSTKSFSIGSGLSFAMRTIYNELDKCQLLCKRCHRKKTNMEYVGRGGYTVKENRALMDEIEANIDRMKFSPNHPIM